MATLTGEQLKNSYQSLVTIGDSITSDPTSGVLENGKGSPIDSVTVYNDATGVSDSSILNLSVLADDSNTNPRARLEASKAGTNGGKLILSTLGADVLTERMRVHSTGDISFRDGSASEAFYWDASAGSLGIGTTSETYGGNALNVVAAHKSLSSVAGGNLAIYTSDSQAINKGGSIALGGSYSGTIGYQFAGIAGLKENATDGNASGYLALYTTNSSNSTIERMRIDSSGNVLIGTDSTDTSTTSGFTVQPDGQCFASADGQQVVTLSRLTSDGEILRFRKDGTAIGSIGTTGGDLYFADATYGGIKPLGDGYAIVPSTNSGADYDNAMSLGASGIRWKDLYLSGNALIGGGNADPTFNRVNGINILSTGAIFARATGSWDLGSNVTAPTHIAFYTDNGSARVSAGNISSSGSTTSFNTSSDYRIKENVVPMEGALDKVAQLKPSEFNFIGEETTMGGFLAHEVQEIVPNAVNGEKDAVDEEGNPMYQSIDHSKLVPILVGAIQELKAEIEQLKAQ